LEKLVASVMTPFQLLWEVSDRPGASDAVPKAFGKAAASWENAQTVTLYLPISKSKTGQGPWQGG
jgi:hypothetical protein